MTWPFERRRHELDEEIESHLAMAQRDRIDRGEHPDAARRASRREFGNIDLVKEVTRDVVGGGYVDALRNDVRHATRRIAHRPGTSAAVVLMLGLAVGMATAMFAITDALVLRPVPFRDPDRLARMYMGTEHGGNSAVSIAVLRAWRQAPAFEGVESVGSSGMSVIAVGDTSTIKASAAVTPGLFPMLGVHPVRGRLLDASDAGTNGILISEDIWRSLLGGVPDITSRALEVDGERMTIIGVLPRNVRFPQWNTEIWRALNLTQTATAPSVILRVASDVALSDALAVATDRAHAADPATAGLTARTAPLAGGYATYYAQAVRILAGAVILVFGVLCANVCSLLLTKFNARRAEFTLRAALGASRGRLMRQAFTESALLAVAGTAVGVCLAWTFITFAGSELPQAFLSQTLNPLRMSARTLAMAGFSATLMTLAIGVAPAIVATRLRPTSSATLKERGGTEGRTARLLTRMLLVGQIAVACTLLIGTALLVRSFLNVIHADRGFDPHGLVAVEIELDRTLAPDAQSRRAAAVAAADALRSLPGVSRLAGSRGGPMTEANNIYFGGWTREGADINLDKLIVEGGYLSADFFHVYGIRLLKGRLFEVGDPAEVVILGERLAKALWPDADPIGQWVLFQKKWRYRVVGVVAETNRPSLEDRDWADLHMPLQSGAAPTTVTLDCGDRCPSEAAIRERVRASSAAARVWKVVPLERAYADDAAQPRATAAVASLFGIVALVVSAAGLFGVLSAATVRRRREFGIRAALGSSSRKLGRIVLLEAVRISIAGVVLGATAAWFLARLLSALQYGVNAHGPLSWTVIAILIVLVASLSAWLPARDAMRADPAVLLREE